MTIKKNIGKNTIGDNKKMEVDLRTYNMSTHDLSTIFRNTQSPGTLVPNLCILAQKGDTIDIDIESHVLTHPTVGPLFGSFKHENHIFSVPIRLYNSWLHNNRTKVGLDMSQIKLPQLRASITSNDNPTQENQFTQINPSCVLAYLGTRGYARRDGTGSIYIDINATPLLGYYDIFKNYYANTQEENFYIINTSSKVTTITALRQVGEEVMWESTTPDNINKGITRSDILEIAPINTYEGTDLYMEWYQLDTNTTKTGPIEDFGVWTKSTGRLIIDGGLGNSSIATIKRVWNKERTVLTPYKLESLDELRDNILTTKGNVVFIVNGTNSGIPLLKNFTARTDNKLNTAQPQFGLALKTYNSDLLQNWVNTEWIDGVNGINEISAVDVSDGQLTMDALNLAQKVYNMLNRIAVSGGTYRDWLETVFTGGNYMERCETPVFEGGMSQEIVFQEVISNSATANEPLGTLAGRGTSTQKQKGGHIKIKVTEPCYIIGIGSITPRIDYSQGNDFFVYHKTLDDIHKPALDGIGYQDSVNWKRAWWDTLLTENNNKIIQPSAGKTVAWIDYMTNINRTFGNFAINNSEAFMVMNRNYELNNNSLNNKNTWIGDLTTYIDPVKFNYIFADTNLDAMNFWVQTKFDIKCRRLISAKQIPNL